MATTIVDKTACELAGEGQESGLLPISPFTALQFHFGNSGFSSWGVKIGRWSWNSRTRKQRVDLPGPISWRSGKTRSEK